MIVKVVGAVYEMLGTEAGTTGKAQAGFPHQNHEENEEDDDETDEEEEEEDNSDICVAGAVCKDGPEF